MIYTRKGDGGETDLADGTRVCKSSGRVACIGELDELNASIGLLLAQPLLHDSALAEERAQLIEVQRKLFSLGAWAAAVSLPRGLPDDLDVKRLETAMNRIEAQPGGHFDGFVLPGGHAAAAQAHVARTLCRRAERTLWTARAESWPNAAHALTYLNRLSDFLYVVARKINRLTDNEEIKW